MINNYTENIKLYDVVVIVSLLIGYFISFMGGILCFTIFTLMSRQITIFGYIIPILAMGVISFTNYSDWQNGDYDIVRYYNAWELLSDVDSIQQALILIYTFRTDYLFWFIEYLFVQVFPDDPRWFGFIFTSLISLLLLLSFRNYCKKENCEFLISQKSSLLIFSLGFFCVIRFFDFTNAYRQHLAIALVIYITSFNAGRKKILLPLLFTLGIHWSMIFVIVPYLLFLGRGTRTLKKSISFICAVIGIVGLPLLLRLFSQFEYAVGYLMSEELGIDKKIMVIQIVTVLIVSLLVYSVKVNSNIRALVLSMVYLSLLFILRSTIIIRMAYNWTDIIVVLSPILFYKTRTLQQYRYCMHIVWFLFILYNLLNINNGIFEYQLFTTYGPWSSVHYVVNTFNPF